MDSSLEVNGVTRGNSLIRPAAGIGTAATRIGFTRKIGRVKKDGICTQSPGRTGSPIILFMEFKIESLEAEIGI